MEEVRKYELRSNVELYREFLVMIMATANVNDRGLGQDVAQSLLS